MLRWTIHAGLILVVVTGMAMAGLALAQTDETDPAVGVATVPDAGFEHILELLAPLVDDGTITEAQAEAVADRLAERVPRHTTFRPRVDVLHIAAETLGIPPRSITADVSAGASLSEIAAAHEVPAEELVAALVAAFAGRVEAAVTAGELTEEQGVVLVDRASARFAEFVTATPEVSDLRRDRHRADRRERAAHLATVIDLLGVTEAELREAFSAGKSLAEVAGSRGVPTDALVGALTAPARERLDAAVAAGELSEGDAQQRLDQLEDKVTERVTAVPGNRRSERHERDRSADGDRAAAG